jgi:hypothetical protein
MKHEMTPYMKQLAWVRDCETIKTWQYHWESEKRISNTCTNCKPKLEFFGLYWALCMCQIFLIGVKTLHVKVNVQYIKEMLNDLDLQLNVTINQWIQGILMFDFTCPCHKILRTWHFVRETFRKRSRNNYRWWQLVRQYNFLSKNMISQMEMIRIIFMIPVIFHQSRQPLLNWIANYNKSYISWRH